MSEEEGKPKELTKEEQEAARAGLKRSARGEPELSDKEKAMLKAERDATVDDTAQKEDEK